MRLSDLTQTLRAEISESSGLRALTTALRTSLSEAATKAKAPKAEVAPVEDVAEECLKAANFIRDCLKHGDHYEEAAAKVADKAEELAKAEDALGTKRGSVDVKAMGAEFQKFLKSSGDSKAGTEDAAVDMKRAVDMLYAPFAKARDTVYRIAAAWDISTKRSSDTKKEASADVKKQSATEIANGIAFAAKNLKTNVRDFLEKGATAQKHLRNAAKKLGLEGGELTDSEKQEIVNAALDFRDASSPMYGRAQGIVRRVNELLDRAAKLEKYEAKKGLKIELEVADDAELGAMELI